MGGGRTIGSNWFQHTAARRRLVLYYLGMTTNMMFQHTAARRRLGERYLDAAKAFQFQHTAARRRLAPCAGVSLITTEVSTHSRPKAAGRIRDRLRDGGGFQHTAARRRLGGFGDYQRERSSVSTHSRPKAAGIPALWMIVRYGVSTHSRPKAAGFSSFSNYRLMLCFNTQPPEGGWGKLQR